MDGHIFITKHIGEVQGEAPGVRLFDIVTQVQLQHAATRFIVHIASPGGNAYEADRIADYLDRLQDRIEVIALGEGLVASAASKIFLTIRKRDAKHGTDFQLMLHNPNGYVDGDASQIEEYLTHVKAVEKAYESFYSEKLSIDKQTLSDLMDSELYIDYEKAKQLSIINYTLAEEPQIIFAYNLQNNTTNLKNSNTMDEKTKTWFQTIFAEIKSHMAKNTINALVIMTKEGKEIVFPGDTPTKGDKVEAPDGTYNFDFKDRQWSIEVAAGVVVSVTESAPLPAGDELDILKAENEALKKELAELKTSQNAIVEEMKAEVETLAAYVKTQKTIQSKAQPDSTAPKFESPKLSALQAEIQALKAQKAKKLQQT